MFCEFCGGGPDCIVCGRSAYAVLDLPTIPGTSRPCNPIAEMEALNEIIASFPHLSAKLAEAGAV